MSRPSPVVLASGALLICLVGCSSSPSTAAPGAASAGSSGASVAASPAASVGRATSSPTPGSTIAPVTAALPAPVSLPSSGRILFTVERDGQATRIAYIDSAGIHLVPFGPDPTAGNAIWAPDNTIIFDSERAGPRHIFRMGFDGGNVVQLTSGDTAQDSAAVSPDGRSMAYGDLSAAEGRDIGIHLANIDGSKVRDLTPGAGNGVDGEDDAAFSPDGQWIAFERVVNPDAGQAALLMIHPDRSGLRRLTPDESGAGYARWSPDGKQVLFQSALSALWIVDVASGATHQISDPKDTGEFIDANWSPDGSHIVYRHFTPGSPATIELHIANADGSNATTLWVGPIGYGPNRPDWQAVP